MLSSIKYVAICTMIGLLVMAGAACSRFSSQSKDVAQRTGNQNAPPNGGRLTYFPNTEQNTVPAPEANPQGAPGANMDINDEASLLVGVWNMTYNGPYCAVQGQMVFQPNGVYSGYTQCSDGSYAVHLTGRWALLQSGVCRLQYDTYRDSEGKITNPQGETFYFRFLDRNRLSFPGGLIAYRAA